MSNLLDKASIILTPTAYNNGEALCVKPSDGSGDFDFSRNSAATRVNAQGLVENVQILSSNLVQNGDFSEEGVEEVSNGSFSQEGVEEITNGDFSNGETDWDFVSTSELTEQGARIYTPDGSYTIVVQNNVLVVGKQYKVTFDVIATDGSSLSNGSGSVVYDTSTIGSKVFYITTDEAGFALKRISGITDVTITNFSVREVGQDWTLGTGWSIGEDKAVCDGTNNADITQVGSIVGKTYKATLSVSENNVGRVNVYIGGTFAGQTTNGATGDFTFYATATDTNLIRIRSNNSFNGSITNISVKEVGQNWDFTSTTTVGDGFANIFSDGSYQYIRQQNVLQIGRLYKLTYEITRNNGGSIKSTSFNTSTLVSDVGIHTLYRTASQARLFIERNQACDIDITNISVIEITTDTNLPRINYEGFSYQDVLGSEEITNGDFATDSDWIKQSSWTISNGTANYDGISSGNYLRQSWSPLTIGKTYRMTFDISDGSAYLQIRSGTSLLFEGLNIVLYGTGSHVIEAKAISNLDNLRIYAYTSGGGTSFSIDNISVKEVTGQEVVPDSGCGSWLFEPQSTNLVTYSEDFSDASWSKSNCVIGSEAVSSPSGVIGVSSVTNTSLFGRLSTIQNVNSGISYTYSFWCKNIDITTPLSIYLNNSGISLDTFTPTSEWVRYQFTWTSSSTITETIAIQDRIGTALGSYMIWGAQLEQQSYATSYIPTEGSTVTRNQDLCTNGGSLASINSTEGTLYFEGSALANTTSFRVISLSDGSTSNILALLYRNIANQFTGIVKSGGSTSLSKTITLADATSTIKAAISYKLNDFKFYVNGVLILADTTGNTPIGLNTLHFADANGTSNKFFGKTKALAVWKEALSDSELQSLTTI